MKLELGMGGGAFKDEDKAMVASVLGTKALDDKGSSSVSKENLLTTICSDENLQNKLSGLNLGWGDGCCREPKQGEESEATKILTL
ncbi:hypothetical protein Gotur_005318 [Gossypium turneri]